MTPPPGARASVFKLWCPRAHVSVTCCGQKAKKLLKTQELCEARERVLSLRERQADRKCTSAATGSSGGRNDGQNGIAYSKSVGEDINAVHNLISDQFRLPACTPGGAGARGRLDTTQGIFGKASDTDSESEFSLACRDRRGKHRKNRQDSLKDKHSGIKDKCSEVVVSKQLYPHATLQQEFLWGWDGNDIEYKDLTFGLFVAGELEIILSDLTNKQECKQRLDMLRLTAYLSQYVKWQKLLHLHAAIIRKIELGLATWDSNFDQMEKIGAGKSRESRLGVTAWYEEGATHTKNIRGWEIIVKHICAKCFQKDGAEHAHGDRDPLC